MTFTPKFEELLTIAADKTTEDASLRDTLNDFLLNGDRELPKPIIDLFGGGGPVGRRLYIDTILEQPAAQRPIELKRDFNVAA